VGDGSDGLRAGALAAIGGGILALYGNLLHPRYSDTDDVKLYGKVANSVLFSVADMLIMLALVLTVVGIVTLARALQAAPHDLLPRYGAASAFVGVGIALAQVGIEVFAFKQSARAFVGAADGNQVSAFWATNAIDHVNTALFATWTIVYLGITPVLLGVAALRRRVAHLAFGVLAIVGGACCAVVGVVNLLHNDQSTTIIPFLIGSILVTAWVIWAGVWMWQRSTAASETDVVVVEAITPSD
jgi:hypothetical protein